MNYLADTTNQLTEAFAHYFCLRMQFRSTVLREGLREELREVRKETETNEFTTGASVKSEAALSH